MGKASRAKGSSRAKVRPPARRSGRAFPAAVAGVFLLGVVLVGLVRSDPGSSNAAVRKGPGAKIGDHWHAAIGVNLCGTWQPNLAQYEPSPNTGVHSHGDGYIHLHPYSAAGAGRNATVGLFYRQAGDTVSAGELQLGQVTYKNGDVCNGLDRQRGLVRWSVNGRERTGDPAAYAPNDGDVIALAFLPRDAAIGTPPAASAGNGPSDLNQ